MTGKVKSFDTAKGYGFITCEGYEKDIFAHYTQIQMEGFKNLEVGQEVEFDIVWTDKGYQAKNIRI